jgi:hypothetical protein
LKFPFLLFFKKGIGMDHRAANPLANEVSRAFVPPCTRRDVSPTGGSSRTSTLFRSAGTLATNSTAKQASCVPIVKPMILFECDPMIKPSLV